MPNPNCLDCNQPVENVVKPVYKVKATEKIINPKPRCEACREKYDVKYVDGGVLEKIS